jgi:hypothetical protein
MFINGEDGKHFAGDRQENDRYSISITKGNSILVRMLKFCQRVVANIGFNFCQVLLIVVFKFIISMEGHKVVSTQNILKISELEFKKHDVHN